MHLVQQADGWPQRRCQAPQDMRRALHIHLLSPCRSVLGSWKGLRICLSPMGICNARHLLQEGEEPQLHPPWLLGLGKNTCNLGEGRSLTIINLRAPSTSEGFGPSKPGPNTFLEGAWSPRARKHTSISLGFGRPIFHSHPDSPKMSPPVPCPNALADQLLLVASWMTIYNFNAPPLFLRSTIQTRRHGLVFGAHGPGCFPEETQFSSK